MSPLKGHGKVIFELPVDFPTPKTTGDAAPRLLETFNTLWHGRDRNVERIPCISGPTPPILKWKTQRRRMEWWPNQVNLDQAGRDSSSDVKYRSSRISTGGHKARGAGVLMDKKLHVSLMDDMYKMTSFNAHPSADLTKGPVPTVNGPSEERGRPGYSDPDVAARGEVTASGGAGATNQPITVQIKKHETEQQTEARMRSYAYFLQQDEEDVWRYANNKSNANYEKERKDLEKSWLDPGKLLHLQDNSSIYICEDPSEVYLDHILARGNPEKKRMMKASGDHAAIIQTSLQIKREKLAASHAGKPHSPDANPDHNALIQLRTLMQEIFTSHRVVSRERIFAALLKKTDALSKLHKMASAYDQARSSNEEDMRTQIDKQLHRWLQEACGDHIKHIQLRNDGMERYVRELDGSDSDNPLRKIVLDVIKAMDDKDGDSGKDHAGSVRRQDVETACEAKQVRFTHALYARIMKEYCVGGRGGWWTLKTGNEGDI